jgi:hypothetical protein
MLGATFSTRGPAIHTSLGTWHRGRGAARPCLAPSLTVAPMLSSTSSAMLSQASSPNSLGVSCMGDWGMGEPLAGVAAPLSTPEAVWKVGDPGDSGALLLGCRDAEAEGVREGERMGGLGGDEGEAERRGGEGGGDEDRLRAASPTGDPGSMSGTTGVASGSGSGMTRLPSALIPSSFFTSCSSLMMSSSTLRVGALAPLAGGGAGRRGSPAEVGRRLALEEGLGMLLLLLLLPPPPGGAARRLGEESCDVRGILPRQTRDREGRC